MLNLVLTVVFLHSGEVFLSMFFFFLFDIDSDAEFLKCVSCID